MKLVLSGNEAVARDCYEYGVHVETAYRMINNVEVKKGDLKIGYYKSSLLNNIIMRS